MSLLWLSVSDRLALAQATENTGIVQLRDSIANKNVTLGSISLYSDDQILSVEIDRRGRAELPVGFDSLLVSAVGYINKSVSQDALRDTLYLYGNTAYSFDQEVVIGASGTLPSIGKVVRLDPKLDALNSNQSPSHLLNQVPGVVMQSGALNTNRISIRGVGNRSRFSTSKLKAYLDNIPLTTGLGETTIEDIDLSLIENMSVSKGPAHPSHGSLLGGAILMNSLDLLSQSSQLRTQITTGSYGLRRQVASAQYTNNQKSLAILASYNSTTDEGHRDNNHYDRSGAALLSKYRFGAHEISLLYNHVSLRAEIPSALSLDDFRQNPSNAAFIWQAVNGYEQTDKHLIGTNMMYQLSADWYARISAAVNIRDSYEVRPFDILDDRQRSYTGRVVLHNDDIWGAKVMIGTELYHEDLKAITYVTLDGGAQGGRETVIDQEVRSHNYFVAAEKSFGADDKWTAQAGVNFSNVRLSGTRDFVLSFEFPLEISFGRYFSPRIGLIKRINPKLNWSAIVSHGYNTPSPDELAFGPIPNQNPVLAEQGWNFETNLQGSQGTRLTYDASLFGMFIDDLIVARRGAFDVITSVNAGSTRHLGLELSGQYILLEQIDQSLTLSGNYAYSRFRFTDFITSDDDFSGNDLTGTAPHVFNNILQYRYRSTSINLQHRYMSQVPLNDANTDYSDSYNLLNIRAVHEQSISQSWVIQLAAGLNNILNADYASQFLINAFQLGNVEPRYYYPGRPRHVYGSLSLRYQFK